MNEIEKYAERIGEFDEKIKELIEKKKKAEQEHIMALGKQHIALFSAEGKRSLNDGMIEFAFSVREDIRRGIFTEDELMRLYQRLKADKQKGARDDEE